MKEKAFISLVLTTCNDSRRITTLLKEIRSALDHTFELYEIIVVDNASEDDTDHVPRRYLEGGRRSRGT